jgi:hypothetical protein
MKATEVTFAVLEALAGSGDWRIQQAAAARSALAQAPAPALGEFRDAVLIVGHHQRLVEEQLERLQRLMWALVVVREITGRALVAYRHGEEAGAAALADIDQWFGANALSERLGGRRD